MMLIEVVFYNADNTIDDVRRFYSHCGNCALELVACDLLFWKIRGGKVTFNASL